MVNVPPLDGVDDAQFRRFISKEGYTPEGQDYRMLLVEQMIRQREQIAIEARAKELAKQMDEARAFKTAKRQRQQLDFEQFPIAEKRHALIVGKGSGTAADFTIFIPAHVDTVDVRGRDDLLRVRTNPEEPDRRYGRGTWDMGAAVLNGIALASSVRVPEGMQIYFAFTLDEEVDSLAAKKIIQSWPQFSQVDLVVSSEIGPFPVPLQPDDRGMRYIIERPGRLKLRGKMHAEADGEGHASLSRVPSATFAYHQWFQQMFWHYQKLPQKKTVFGRDQFEHGGMRSEENPYYSPGSLEFWYSVRCSGQSLENALQEQIVLFSKIKGQCSSFRAGISGTLTGDPQHPSYAPFGMVGENDAVAIVEQALEKVSGAKPVPVAGSSVADENLYAEAMARRMPGGTFIGTRCAVVSIPPIGNHAHSYREWVSWSDIARVREAFRMLIEDPAGFRRFLSP